MVAVGVVVAVFVVAMLMVMVNWWLVIVGDSCGC